MDTQSHVTREITHDFFSDRKWLSSISGFGESATVGYTVYKVVILITLTYMQIMAVFACIYDPRKQPIINAVHFMLVALFTYWCIVVRLVFYKYLDRSRLILSSGVYRYDDEDTDEELMKMKEMIPAEIRWKNNVFLYMFVLGAITNTTLFPLSQLALLDADLGNQPSIVNPYFPHLFYQPFNTRTPAGIVAGYIIGAAYFFFEYSISCATIWYYISGVVQMKIHFRVLNHSIKNVQRRAFLLYTKKQVSSTAKNITPKSLLDDEHFQQCLYICFRSNVQHHQAILRLRKTFEPFSGSFSLAVLSLSSMVYGCLLYLLYQDHPINVAINLFLAFSTEQFTVIFMCFLGEDVLAESEKVFYRLYRLPWFNYSKKFNKILHIMMSNTLRPTGVKALLVGVPASLETYGHVVTAMYKVMNLVRQSDIV